MSDKKKNKSCVMAIIAAEGKTVVGYAPNDFYLNVGDRVVFEDNEEGIVVWESSYSLVEKLYKTVEATKLDLVRIMAKKMIDHVDWSKYDEKGEEDEKDV